MTPRIISFVTIPTIDQPESTINMGSSTPQTAHDGRFSIRSAFDCHLAHICSEAREAYLKTYKPLFGDCEGYAIIYANLEKDAIHFAHFEMWHLQAFARSIDKTQIRELILQYNTTMESAFYCTVLFRIFSRYPS